VKAEFRRSQLDNECVLVDDFVMALSQLAMNLHAKTHELKNFLFVEQFRHEFHQFTLINSTLDYTF